MVDFDMKPREKTAEEKAFDELNEKYVDKFGSPYVFDFAAESMTWEEALADIRRRIAENDPQHSPDYDPKYVY